MLVLFMLLYGALITLPTRADERYTSRSDSSRLRTRDVVAPLPVNVSGISMEDGVLGSLASQSAPDVGSAPSRANNRLVRRDSRQITPFNTIIITNTENDGRGDRAELDYNGATPPTPANSVKVKIYTSRVNPQKIISEWTNAQGQVSSMTVDGITLDLSTQSTILTLVHTRRQVYDVLYAIGDALQQEFNRPPSDIFSDNLSKVDGKWQVNIAANRWMDFGYMYMLFRSPETTPGRARADVNLRAMGLGVLLVAQAITSILDHNLNGPDNRAAAMNNLDNLFLKMTLWVMADLVKWASAAFNVGRDFALPLPSPSELDDALALISSSGAMPQGRPQFTIGPGERFYGVDKFRRYLGEKFYIKSPYHPGLPMPLVPGQPNQAQGIIQTT